jgi:hypothetical protein
MLLSTKMHPIWQCCDQLIGLTIMFTLLTLAITQTILIVGGYICLLAISSFFSHFSLTPSNLLDGKETTYPAPIISITYDDGL